MLNLARFVISDYLIQADRFCDKVPLISTVTNVVDIVAKFVLSKMDLATDSALRDWKIYISNKPLWKCLILCVPVIGNVIVYFYPQTVRNVLNDLLGNAKKYDLLPLHGVSEKEIRDPQKMTAPVMKGKLADGRPYIAVLLQHKISPADYQALDDMVTDLQQHYKQEYTAHPIYERVLVIHQRNLDSTNIWHEHDARKLGLPEPQFILDSMTTEYGYVNHSEQSRFASLKKLFTTGESTDHNQRVWHVVNYDKFAALT